MKQFDFLTPFFLCLTLIFFIQSSFSTEPFSTINKEKIFIVIIPKNTVLFDINNKKDLKTHKKIYAKALSTSPKNSFLTLLDHHDKPRFLVHSNKSISLKREISLKEKILFFKPSFKKVKEDSYDKSLLLNQNIIFELNFFDLSLYDSKKNSSLKLSKSYSSILYDLTFKSKLPFYFGFNICLSKEETPNSLLISKMDFGLTLKTKEFSYLKIKNLQLSIYGLQTFFHKLSIKDKMLDLSTSTINVKLSKMTTIMKKYEIKIGVGTSHHLTFRTNKNDTIFFDQNSYYSYGIFIGFQHKSVL